MPEIITRAEAKARGLKRYFTGKPCKREHIAERYTAIDRMRANEEWLIAAGEYAVMQNLSTLRRRKERSVVPVQVVAAKREEREAKIAEVTQQILLLNMEMPNGKRMRYCTREEMAGFNKGYERLIKKMKPGQMVGQAFNEDQVKALMK